MVVGENVENEVVAASMEGDLILVVTSTLPLIFTKLPLCHSELQKCHSWASNVGPFTLLTWK